jgi:Zn-dependent peptidase ImmA (M78 family)/transcriptional regulator with XRE-family HTH domain
MRGTPGFAGSRLIEAREARGLTVSSLAELIGISSQNISQYEHGKQSPSPEVMARICERLNLDLRFFLRPTTAHDFERVCFRSMSSATKAARIKALRRFGWLKEIVSYLREYLDLPKLNLPAFNVPTDISKIHSDLIEEIATECRRYWQLGDGPIADMVLTLENNGIIVSSAKLDAETLDAFSQWCSRDGTPYVVLGLDKYVAVRLRFNAAHELAHLILHRSIDKRQLNSSVTHKLMEDQAHRFASAFLMPANRFSEEVWAPTLEGFRSLKSYWRVSIGAMISRCEQLGIISYEQGRRLWIYLNRKGWKKAEPLDDQIHIEQPRLLRRSFQMLVEDGIKTRGQIIYDLRLTPSDIEELSLLSLGFFNGLEFVAAPRVRELESESSSAKRVGNGGVLLFPGKEE